ncbi:hypothetical protein [Mameliella sp.]|uniref:hypothetical protein n=1 Tax=Mameliella sp. TaxID=1924940 RepID=UPI003BAC3577
MKPLALIAALLAGPAWAGDVCHDIDATQGWQDAEFPAGLVQDVRSTGFWSVAPGLTPAGTSGHGELDAKALAARPEARPLVSALHGALLVRFEVAGTRQEMDWARFHGAIQQVGSFNMNVDSIAFRINEGDADLADNDGALTVCFRYSD